jgi:predicted signal transduction protein with EAL and GGDEF domain
MLELELTESALVHNMDIVTPMLHRLRGHGFSLALDDFGTGYSSLSYLRHLPFDKVKIDRSFVMDIETDPAANRLLESIVQLCKVLGMRTVAEGRGDGRAAGRAHPHGRGRVPGLPLRPADAGGRVAGRAAPGRHLGCPGCRCKVACYREIRGWPSCGQRRPVRLSTVPSPLIGTAPTGLPP